MLMFNYDGLHTRSAQRCHQHTSSLGRRSSRERTGFNLDVIETRQYGAQVRRTGSTGLRPAHTGYSDSDTS